MTEENTTNEDQKQARFSPIIFIVLTCIFIAVAFFAHIPETVMIFLVELAILFGVSLMVLGLGTRSIVGRVVTNALVGAIAGSVPGLVFQETVIKVIGNGGGGLLSLALLAFGTGLGLIVGGIGVRFELGIRVISPARIVITATAACIGSALVAYVAWQLVGMNDEFVVVVLSVLGMLAGMWLSTDRSSDTSRR